jgi:tetrahydromethanopterin S-methyltransferase subunit F
MLYERYADEVRTSLDFANRNLSFYVGLLSALFAGILAGLFNVQRGDLRAFALLIGPCLIVLLAELGYSMFKTFYHRFIDTCFTLANVQQMLRLNDPSWVSQEINEPFVRNKYGGFLAQWVDPIDWLGRNPQSTVEEAKNTVMKEQLIGRGNILKGLVGKGDLESFRAATLVYARRTMWAFEFASVLLVPGIFVIALS